ncbi:MAG: M23 family metallopeptidase [Gracilimonas sp.]|uniref:M23 family metallopeptidase n=1 Tax=Gracilimonas sp. TaxID=1974203 RepID=UPI00199E65FA|nr:M23 family metallopeptidase [Gracilimonas sp.]MBD3617620.1 M23 family metallopeptidase [Gracilimonas sp.]
MHSQHYLWPTDSGQYLSSTFGETREAHFHAGLDIKTWGREGYRVFASRDGVLYRLLVTERGYGKAIYLKHPDGTFTVYAHLQRFNDEFQALADSIRLKDFSFEMDAQLDTLGIFVEQGDVIGYTGSTGIGPPHLHFEVRDSLQNPVNALTTNLRVKDDIPPVFSSLIVEPLSKNSRIEQHPVSHNRRPEVKNGIYDFGEVKVSGKAGLAVNVYDQANDVYNAYAVHTLALIHQSDTLFYEELNSFPFDESGEMFLDRIAPFGSTRRGHQRLYGKDGNQNPFYLIDKPGARIHASDSTRTYTIVAADYFGNTSTARITITPDPETPFTFNLPSILPALENWYWHEDWVSPDLNNTFSLNEGLGGFHWKETQQIFLRGSLPPINFARIFPEYAQKVHTPDRRLSVKFNANSFFDTLSVAVSYALDDEILLSIQPQMLAVKSEFRIEFFLGDYFEEGNRYRLFRVSPSDGELSYVDSELRGQTVHGYPSEPGNFIIKADNEPPQMSDFKVYKTDYGKWLATVHIEDELSGVKASSAEFIINGEQGIAEYDYEEELLIYYHPQFMPEEVNTVIISVEDKAGNHTLFSVKHTVPDF